MLIESTLRQASTSRFRAIAAACALLVAALSGSGAAEAGDPPTSPPLGIFIYTISRDGEPIGQQRLEFVGDGNKLRVISHTDLDVRFLGLSLYGFDQQVEEVRADGKIVSLSSEADDDGTDKKVDLTLQSGRLKGEFNGKAIKHDIDPSLSTSLFWQQPPTGTVTVLDCLRGKAREVTVSDLGAATLDLPVGRVRAHHLRVAGDIARELWYDAKGILVAGQATAKDGSTVRQELQQRP